MVALRYWQEDGFNPKGNYRVNTSADRKDLISDVAMILGSVDELKHPDYGDIAGFYYAVALENSGNFVKALGVYSDLISREASIGVDLSLIILRAAGNSIIVLVLIYISHFI